MRPFILPVFLFAMILGASSWISAPRGKKKKDPAMFTVSGKVTSTYTYCGGAAPTEQVLKEAETPRPVPGMTLYIKKGNVNGKSALIDSVVTDKDGKYSLKLKPGSYCIVEKWKTAPYVAPVDSKYVTYDRECHRALYAACDRQLEVTKNVDDVNINFHRACDWHRPCERYDGPLPPSAPPNRGTQPGHQE